MLFSSRIPLLWAWTWVILTLLATSIPLFLPPYCTWNRKHDFESFHQIVPPTTAASCSFPQNLGLQPPLQEGFILHGSLSPILLYSNSWWSQCTSGWFYSTTFLASWFPSVSFTLLYFKPDHTSDLLQDNMFVVTVTVILSVIPSSSTLLSDHHFASFQLMPSSTILLPHWNLQPIDSVTFLLFFITVFLLFSPFSLFSLNSMVCHNCLVGNILNTLALT